MNDFKKIFEAETSAKDIYKLVKNKGENVTIIDKDTVAIEFYDDAQSEHEPLWDLLEKKDISWDVGQVGEYSDKKKLIKKLSLDLSSYKDENEGLRNIIVLSRN
jgi:hypothetical protein